MGIQLDAGHMVLLFMGRLAGTLGYGDPGIIGQCFSALHLLFGDWKRSWGDR